MTIDNLFDGIVILRKYNSKVAPIELIEGITHDTVTVTISPRLISASNLLKLMALGFLADYENGCIYFSI